MIDHKTAVLTLKYSLYQPTAPLLLRSALENQRLSPEDLQHLNWEKRKRLVREACCEVPYYRDRYRAAGVAPKALESPEDWCNLPILTREDVKTNFADLVSPRAAKRHVRAITTGGSTGQPLKVLHDLRFPMEILVWRMLLWWGLTPGVDGAYVWRLLRTSRLSRWLNALMWWPTRRIRLDASSMSDTAVKAFVRRFNQVRPPLLQGYVGALDYLASYIEENALCVHPPRAVWVTASPVSETQRRRLERVFKAPVYDQYACSEVFWIAAQCRERHGLHVFTDFRHVEFVDEDGNPCPAGSWGRLVVTDLENRAFPLIRYANGDMGRFLVESCKCGIRLPLMDAVRGRVSDTIRLPDGTRVDGAYLTTVFDDYPDAVKAFRIHQRADFSITLSVVPNPADGSVSKVLEQVHATLEAKTGRQVPIAIEQVDAIPHDRGKTRFIITDVGVGQ